MDKQSKIYLLRDLHRTRRRRTLLSSISGVNKVAVLSIRRAHNT